VLNDLRRRRHRIRLVLLLAGLTAAGAAQAQWSGRVGIDSDFRFRGVSLSRGHPSPRAGIAVDFSKGAYLGATVAQVEPDAGQRDAQATLYGGFAQRLSDGRWAWETGLAATQVGGDDGQSYFDAFAGLIAEGWTVRYHETPKDLVSGLHTRYIELNGGQAISDGWRLAWHAGALYTVSDPAGPNDSRRWRIDARIGAAFHFNDIELQLAWVGAQRDAAAAGDALPYGPRYEPYRAPTTRRSTLVLGASLVF
jgi:uncharacterized protein (TIGR02001 family)